ncbi:MAG TPA: XamI family restriction endonuclease [Longimicrobiaceae bacterium]|nr:XamI family restriction endonuclease [Longimicrobiaceae bacterium]
MEEPLEDYLEAFEEYMGVTEDLLETTVDLTDLEGQALHILSDQGLTEAFRYLSGPPISLDDLKTLASAPSLHRKHLEKDPSLVRRIVQTVLIGLDRQRFPWLLEGREPSEAERSAAVLASAALMATRRVGTKRRSAGKREQEERVEAALLMAGMRRVPTRNITNLALAPEMGEFCRESMLGNRKADFVVRLWDQRILPIECKVSNSATNSVKRLNNDAAAKAEVWRQDFGARQVVPAAVLSGVYKLRNLEDAQARGLSLFWAHDLDVMLQWIEATRP